MFIMKKFGKNDVITNNLIHKLILDKTLHVSKSSLSKVFSYWKFDILRNIVSICRLLHS